jgi:hypothetical protein
MSSKITTLINKYDNCEILRDEVAAILAIEVANQKVLAVAEGERADDYSFDVYTERSSPWELIEDENGKIIRQSPLVNVYLESENADGSMLTTIDSMAYDCNITIDCLAAKVHKVVGRLRYAGDELAARDVQRIARLIRNILMSPLYYKLNMPEVVHYRRIESITMFQPNFGDRPAQSVVGARINLKVSITENVPQAEFEFLELVQGRITRAEDGLLLAELQFEDET